MSLYKKLLSRTVEIYDVIFWGVILIGLVFVLNSYPMMKVRFDIWQHIGNIDRLIFDPSVKITRTNWHAVWAFILRTLGPSDVFTHATIVHRSQFILNAIIIYQASKQIFTALFEKDHFAEEKIKNQCLSSLALCSVLVWFTIIGTVSTFQQAWIMWYSVNYQITLSFLFLSLALIVNVICLEQSKIVYFTKLSAALILLILIYLFHAGELAYLVFYLPIIAICFFKKINLKKLFIALSILGLIVFLAEKFYVDIRPELVNLLLSGDFAGIKNKINIYGTYNILGGNRYDVNWNELYSSSIFLAAPITFLAWNISNNISRKILLFIILSLIFCFIPSFKFSAGIASLISYDGIVNRYYFASFVFLLLPLFIYLILFKLGRSNAQTSLIVIVLSFMTIFFNYSKYVNNKGTYYQNVNSILQSAKQKKINIGVSDLEIESIGRQIKIASAKYGNEKFTYCSNYDKGHVIKYVYRKENVAFDRFPDYYAFDHAECMKSFVNSVEIK